MQLTRIVALAIVILASFGAHAAEKDTGPNPLSVPAFKALTAQGAVFTYIGKAYGLDGWLAVKGTDVQFLYSTPDGQGVVVGMLYGPNTENITAKQLEKLKAEGVDLAALLTQMKQNQRQPVTTPQAVGASAYGEPPADAQASAGVPATPSTPQATAIPQASAQPQAASASAGGEDGQSTGEQALADLEHANWIEIGNPSAPPMYIVVDPNCHFCHSYYQDLMTPYLATGQVRLRLVVVGVLGPQSRQQAASLFAAKNPADAWNRHLRGDDSQLPPSAATPDMLAKVMANEAIFQRWHMNGTPYSLYRAADGKVHLVFGEPDQVAAVISDLPHKTN